MSNPEYNDDIYLQMARHGLGQGAASMNSSLSMQIAASNRRAMSVADYFSPGHQPTPSKLEKAKKWLKDNGGAHPGCLDRFMQARSMKCEG